MVGLKVSSKINQKHSTNANRKERIAVNRNIIALFPILQNDKKTQLEGKLKDVRFRLSAQRREVEQTNQTRETRIAEITLLQQQLQVRKTSANHQHINTQVSHSFLLHL